MFPIDTEKLLQLFVAADMTVNQLAQRTGISRRTLVNALSTGAKVNRRTLSKLAAFFDIEEWLLVREGGHHAAN